MTMQIKSDADHKRWCYLAALYYEYHCEKFDLTLDGHYKNGTHVPFNLTKAQINALQVMNETCKEFGLNWKDFKSHLMDVQNITFFELQSLYLESLPDMPDFNKRNPSRLKSYKELW